MNWKNVLFLMRVERKSGRLLRGVKATKYKENRFFANWAYWLALAIGLAVGLIVGLAVYLVALTPEVTIQMQQVSLGIFVSLPTIVLVYCLVLTLLQQIQRSGVKVSAQAPYWLPITWQEHTLASILSSLFGFPFASVLCISAGLIAFSAFTGLVFQAVLTSLALFGAAFMASATTEILRILQVRFIGAVYKSSGRASIWVRFAGTLAFFIAFYAIYFYVINGGFTFIQAISQTQSSIWFVPYVWLGLTLSDLLLYGALISGIGYLIMSILFIALLFSFAVLLNRRFGLYEPPAISVSKKGIYTPKTGFLGKIGFSTSETALIKKDLRAFTRRRELISVFITPIVIVLVPIMQSFNQTAAASVASSLIFPAIIFLLPTSFMAMILGTVMIGEEGQAIWRIYASPISAKNIVRSKYFFIVLFSVIILVITGIIGIVIYHPSLRMTIVAISEAVLLTIALGAVSLAIGFKGADFTEIPRPKLVRQSWSMINLALCLVLGIAVLSPLIPYFISSLIGSFMPWTFDPFVVIIISGVIAVIISVIFYRISMSSAKDLLGKAEM